MKTTVVDYLVKKLEFLGINHIFGLPGIITLIYWMQL